MHGFPRMKSARSMHQGSLFLTAELPEGFLYQSDFLTVEDEADIISAIRALNFEVFDFHGYKAKRRIVQYGWDYDFGTRKASVTRPIPEFLHQLQARAAKVIGVARQGLVEAVVTEYSAGAPIGWHRDVPQFEDIIGISLLGECRMRLKPYKADGKVLSIVLEPRSLYVMSGAARWKYQHSIPPVKSLRYSITFRTLREGVLDKAG